MFVSNTSTLILLAKVDLLGQFIENFGKIEITGEVSKEFSAKDSFDAKFISRLIEEKKVIVKKAESNMVSGILMEFSLDKGEATAFALFNEKRHKAILTDDYELIKLCMLREVQFLSAMAIVVRMKEKKILSKEEALQKINELNSYGRYSRELLDFYVSEVKK
ncbi:MAG: hypothetical protein QT03_C0001G1246 [archaeon GW2011_AR10]|uniref:DUF3368 domain-containing protein n=1 Tax=Candidatus Iainarchaeum sp. TaxID=3101447 RepID=A0A7J4IWK1_9ARCH|nr:MAG: hypothetical protein QT03_C0001G1246 [archaeon GW2011_AR10]HIH08137.1 hypothetical protein [Candidatus Diapherotrites archaeon]